MSKIEVRKYHAKQICSKLLIKKLKRKKKMKIRRIFKKCIECRSRKQPWKRTKPYRRKVKHIYT